MGGQGGRGGGTSPTRDLEVKKAMKAISSRLPRGGDGIAAGGRGRMPPQGEGGAKGGLLKSIGGSGSGRQGEVKGCAPVEIIVVDLLERKPACFHDNSFYSVHTVHHPTTSCLLHIMMSASHIGACLTY